MNKMFLSALAIIAVLSGNASAGPAAAQDQSAVISGIMRDVTELGDILQKKHAVFSPSSISTNITAAIIKAIDPYGEVLTREQVERRSEELRGIFYGVGLTISIKNKMLSVMDIVKGGPAEAAGIRSGGVIEKIGGQKTEGMPLEQAVSKLRGARDEIVTLTILSGEKNTVTNEYSLKRTAVQMPVTGVTEQWPQQICYLKVNGLYENSGAQIATQIVAWANTNCSGIIFDLRGADGGDLQSAADVAGLFQPSDPVTINVRDGSGTTLATYQGKAGQIVKLPVMVLVNNETCAAAEALAAAFGICKNALLVGAATRGDNSVRETIPLSDGRMIYLATGRIEIKNGTAYQGAGVAPHVAVTRAEAAAKQNEDPGDDDVSPFGTISEQDKQNRALIRRTKGDAPLQRATDILLGLKALDIKGR